MCPCPGCKTRKPEPLVKHKQVPVWSNLTSLDWFEFLGFSWARARDVDLMRAIPTIYD